MHPYVCWTGRAATWGPCSGRVRVRSGKGWMDGRRGLAGYEIMQCSMQTSERVYVMYSVRIDACTYFTLAPCNHTSEEKRHGQRMPVFLPSVGSVARCWLCYGIRAGAACKHRRCFILSKALLFRNANWQRRLGSKPGGGDTRTTKTMIGAGGVSGIRMVEQLESCQLTFDRLSSCNTFELQLGTLASMFQDCRCRLVELGSYSVVKVLACSRHKAHM